RGAVLLLLEHLALLLRLLLQLLLQRLALLLQNLGVGWLAVERRPQVLQRNVEGDLPPRNVAAGHPHDDAHGLPFFQLGQRLRPDFDFRRAGVRKAHVVLAVERLPLVVDDHAEAGPQPHADRRRWGSRASWRRPRGHCWAAWRRIWPIAGPARRDRPSREPRAPAGPGLR